MTKPEQLSGAMEIWQVPLRSILNRWNPLRVWGEDPIRPEEIRAAIADGTFAPLHSNQMPAETFDRGEKERAYHIARVAWLVANPDSTQIDIDIGCPSFGCHPRNGSFEIQDGNHRLAAASLRGETTIAVSPSGELSYMKRRFRGAVPLE